MNQTYDIEIVNEAFRSARNQPVRDIDPSVSQRSHSSKEHDQMEALFKKQGEVSRN